MRRILDGSLIWRVMTAVAVWIDRQWEKSFLSRAFRGSPTRAADSLLGSAAARVHGAMASVFSALRLDRLFDGSVFRRSFLWTCIAAFAAPLLPTMPALGLTLLAEGSLILEYCCDRERRLGYSPVNKWICAFATIYMVCAAGSVTGISSVKTGALVVSFILFSLTVSDVCRDGRRAGLLINVLVASGMAVALIGVLQAFVGIRNTGNWVDTSFSELSGRVYATLDNPNVLSEYLLLMIPLAVSAALTAKTANGRLAAALAALVMVGCMVLTWSRGGWLALALSAAVFLVLLDRRFIVIGIVALAGIILVLPDSIMRRLASSTNMADSSTHYRVSIWMGTVEMLKKYWFCGVGPDAFESIYPFYSLHAAIAQHAHNLYLQLVAETGVMGLGVFLGGVGSLVRSAGSALWEKPDRDTRLRLIAVLSSLAGFLGQGIVEHSFYNNRVTLAFWCVVGLGMALARMGRRADG